ncbi:MAG: thiamine-phosphate kinase [Phycisphaerae bacterium]
MPKGELAFVEWLRGVCRVDPARVLIGIGDDMAAVALDGRLVLTTADMLLDGVHFDTRVQSLRRIGRKAVACSLSDCAAMAARPRGAMVSVALPNAMSMDDARQLYDGMLAIGAEYDCPIIGGDTTSWDHPLAIDVSMIAEPMSKRGPVRRSGAQPGDVLLVTGALGGSLAGRHLDFTPRLADAEFLVNELGESLHAMIDITDGLAIDAFRICQASGCAACFDVNLLTAAASDDARRASQCDGRSLVDHVLNDGEDFELLLAVPPPALPNLNEAPHVPMPVGEIVPLAPGESPGLRIRHAGRRIEPLEPGGYQHFR